MLLSLLNKQNTPKAKIAVSTGNTVLKNQTLNTLDKKKLSPGIHPGPYPKTEIYVDKSGASIIHCAGGFDRMVEIGLVDEKGYIRSSEAHIAYRLAEKRNQKNAELNAAVEAQGIKLTDKDVFTLSVNFDNTITVSGHSDEARGKEIERALNDSDLNYSALAYHIRETVSNFRTFTQCTDLEYKKYSINNSLMKHTGYSINQLTVRNDGIFTDDGKNIQELFYNAVAGMRPDDPGYAGQYTSYIMRGIRQVEGSGGIQNVRNISVSIEYRNNSLCDIGTPFGFGADQRDWYDKLISIEGGENQYYYSASIGLLPPWRMPASSTADNSYNSFNDLNPLFEYDSDQRDWFTELLSVLGEKGWKSYAALIGLTSKDNVSYYQSLDIKA